MKFALRFIALLILISPFNKGYSQVVKSAHPRLFLDAGVITQLQTRAAANTAEWQELQDRIDAVSGYSASEILDLVYEGQEYAFMFSLSYYMTGNTAHRDTAISIFTEFFNEYTSDSSMYWDRGYESRSTLFETAVLYDWLYNDLSASFRTTVRTRLVHWANWILYDANTYGRWGTYEFFEGNNYCMGHLVGITACAYAIETEDATNGDFFIAKTDSVLPIMKNFANTRLHLGDANEGWGYGAGYAINFFKTMAMIKTATVAGTDHFTSTTYDEDVMKFLPHATLPNHTHMLAEGDWARESTGELWDYNRIMADMVSTYSDMTTARQVARFWGNETVPISNFGVSSFRWYPFLFCNTDITPADYRTLPDYSGLYIYTDTIGTDQFIRRTGWTANDQWVSYRGGGRYGDHAHNGSGHFSVYDQEWLLIDLNIQTHSGIEGSDSMHNCIHFDLMNNDEMYPFADDYNLAEHTQGKRRDLNAEYSYLWTRSTPIYTARSSYYNVVSQSERQFMYLPQLKKIAIFDLTETNDPEYTKAFGFHYTDNASIAADSSYTYYAGDYRTAAVHTCYPLDRSVEINGQSVRVRNAIKHPKDYFMHLVSVQDNGSPVVNVIPVNRENGRVLTSDFYGSFHSETGKNYCILFAGDNPVYNYDSLEYEVPATQTLHNYIAGLDPFTTYFVSSTFPGPGIIRIKVSEYNHAGSTPFISTSGGILSFELTQMTGVTELSASIWFDVYYNQDMNGIFVQDHSTQSGPYEVCLFSSSGEMVTRSSGHVSGNLIIPAAALARGMYLVNIRSGNHTFSRKIAIY